MIVISSLVNRCANNPLLFPATSRCSSPNDKRLWDIRAEQPVCLKQSLSDWREYVALHWAAGLSVGPAPRRDEPSRAVPPLARAERGCAEGGGVKVLRSPVDRGGVSYLFWKEGGTRLSVLVRKRREGGERNAWQLLNLPCSHLREDSEERQGKTRLGRGDNACPVEDGAVLWEWEVLKWLMERHPIVIYNWSGFMATVDTNAETTSTILLPRKSFISLQVLGWFITRGNINKNSFWVTTMM